MTDKELLELAAKAAGVDLKWEDGKPHIGDWLSRNWWNPLTDDGDALRLAVKLKLDMVFEFDRIDVTARHMGDVTEYIYELPKPTDEYAATRRAIVRAAAEIGKTL